MREQLPALFALFIAAVGWFYLFYSRAAQRLGEVEQPRRNLQRVRLRQINGFLLIVLGIGMFAGFHGIDRQQNPGLYLIIWGAVILLVPLVALLAVLDLRLTWKLRNRSQQ